MICRQWTAEISERSRRGASPGDDLSDHLAECPACAARWETEAELSRSLRVVRSAVSGLRSPDSHRAAMRARLLAEFDARAGVAASSPRAGHPRWAWMAVAATVVLALALGIWRQPAAPPRMLPQASAQVDAAAEDGLADNDFVPVPYAPPLAQGEFVEVVRMDLSPAVLARMGFITQAGYSGDVTTDLVIGEDGLPRAVRVPESVGIRF